MIKNEYNNHSKQERQSKGQFFTPELVLEKMFKYVTKTGTLLDNSMGSGNILAYAIQKRGFEPSKCYGIEFDPEIYEIAVERLTQLGIPKENLVLGDALSRDSYRFGHLVNEKHFDLAVINPPYKIGNKVCWEALNRSDFVVCLMPLSKYKRQKLWQKITNFEIPFTREETEGKLFTDALITPNLSISTLENNAKPKFETESNLTLEGYSKDFLEVYKWNMEHKGLGFIENTTLSQDWKERNIELNKWFLTSLRAGTNGVHSSGLDYDWNHNLEPNEVPKNAGFCYYLYKMASEKAKDNLTTWWYYKGKKGLANSLLKGLNKASGSCEDAIPQINWEEIENTDAWKAGDYDTAVLDMMGLEMVGGKIVKKSTALFNSEEALNLESYNPDLRLVYEYNLNHKGTAFTEGGRKNLKSCQRSNVNNKEWFAVTIRASQNLLYTATNWGRDWNHKKDVELRENIDSTYAFYKMTSEKAKDNLVKWSDLGKGALSGLLLGGLNSDGGDSSISIPQIDFEKIEESPLWKQGLYDEAVLDAMNLKMENGVVVKKSTALFDSEEALEFESFDPNLRPFYDYNKEHWGSV